METQDKEQTKKIMREKILRNIEETKRITRWSILDDNMEGNPELAYGVHCDTSGLRHRGCRVKDFFKFAKYGNKAATHTDFENALAGHINHLIQEHKKWVNYAETDYTYWRLDYAKMAQAYAKAIFVEQKLLEGSIQTPYADKLSYGSFRTPFENRDLTAKQWEDYKRAHLNPEK